MEMQTNGFYLSYLAERRSIFILLQSSKIQFSLFLDIQSLLRFQSRTKYFREYRQPNHEPNMLENIAIRTLILIHSNFNFDRQPNVPIKSIKFATNMD